MKKKIKNLKLLWGLFLLPIFVFSGCLKEGDDTAVLPIPTGKIPYSVIPENLQDSLTNNGFVIREGINPPIVKGKYTISPMELQYASDNYINNFYDLTMTYSGQHPRGRIDYSEVQNGIPGKSIEAHVIGDGNDFSMYCTQLVVNVNSSNDTNWWCKIATVVSGTICDTGIVNCQYAYVMLDQWARIPYYATQMPPVETFRFWNDGDGMTIKLNN